MERDGESDRLDQVFPKVEPDSEVSDELYIIRRAADKCEPMSGI